MTIVSNAWSSRWARTESKARSKRRSLSTGVMIETFIKNPSLTLPGANHPKAAMWPCQAGTPHRPQPAAPF